MTELSLRQWSRKNKKRVREKDRLKRKLYRQAAGWCVHNGGEKGITAAFIDERVDEVIPSVISEALITGF